MLKGEGIACFLSEVCPESEVSAFLYLFSALRARSLLNAPYFIVYLHLNSIKTSLRWQDAFLAS